MPRVETHHHGADPIRLLKIVRGDSAHSVRDLSISVFAESAPGSPPSYLAPEAIKHTVEILADSDPIETLEPFGLLISRTLMERYDFLRRVTVEMTETPWSSTGAELFQNLGAPRPIATIDVKKETYTIESGIEGLQLLRTGGLAFEGYVRDLFSGTQPQNAPVWCAHVRARWQYSTVPESFSVSNAAVLDAIRGVFAVEALPAPHSLVTLAGEAALSAAPELQRIIVSFDTRELIPADLERFGKENRRSLFSFPDLTLGLVEVTVHRE